MDSLDNFMQTCSPTANRPLLGLTVLVVEDSRFASQAMRLLCLRSGARIRRADSLQSAKRHLAVYRPSAVIIDIGLPDGSGVDLIRELAIATPRVSVILGTSGDPASETLSLKAGADGFIEKPISNIGLFQSKILKHLPKENARTLRYVTQFLGGIARSVDDAHLEQETKALAHLQTTGREVNGQIERVTELVQRRISRTALM